MKTYKIALTLLLAISPVVSQASAPEAAKIGIKAAAGTLVTGSKLATVAKGTAIIAGLAFVAETGYCLYRAKGNPEESARIFNEDLKFAQEKGNALKESAVKFGVEKSNQAKDFFNSKFGKTSEEPKN